MVHPPDVSRETYKTKATTHDRASLRLLRSRPDLIRKIPLQ